MNIPLSAILYQITDVCDWYPQNVALYNSYESILLFEPDHAESVKDNCLCFLTEGMLENLHLQRLAILLETIWQIRFV